jgi:hypothetical protein
MGSRSAGAMLLLGLTFGIDSAAVALDASTAGGLVVGARVVRVTTLADSGPGAFRAALDASGPRVIVFDVGGYVDLRSDLTIAAGQVTIAGQTAPGSGIVIRGGSLRIRASDVVIEHMAFYPGSTRDPQVAENRDGISIYGSPSRRSWIRNVVLRNVSVGWGVDENLGIQGLVDGVRIERSLIAEPLMRGGHPRGVHSMNLLLANSARGVVMLGNVFAFGNQRNPRLTQGNEVLMANNYIYGFGRAATHLDTSREILNPGRIDIVNNLYQASTDSPCNRPTIQIARDFLTVEPRTRVFISGNVQQPHERGCSTPLTDVSPEQLEARPNHQLARWTLLPAGELLPGVLDAVGSRPAARNPIDARIVQSVRQRSGRLIDSELDVGGWPAIAATRTAASQPAPDDAVSSEATLAALRAFLCQRHTAVGGARTAC